MRTSIIFRYGTAVSALAFLLLLLSGPDTSAQCPIPAGDQISYGDNSWIGYVYGNFITTAAPFVALYRGYVTEPDTFNRNYDSGSISGSNVCGSYSDQFSVRYKMKKNFPAGHYTFLVGGDDGYRLSIDGGATWLVSNWSDHSYTTSSSASVYLNGDVYLVLEYYENGGLSQVSFSYCAGMSSAPTGISGTATICSAQSTTLTATGGIEGIGSVYQWGTGNTPGNNVISGENNASITVSPTATTTYWVRRIDLAACNNTTSGVTQAVTVVAPSTAPTSITGTTTLCAGNSTTLTASGGILGGNGSYQWGTGTVAGANVIAGQTGASITVTPSSTTTYWVRRVDSGTCAGATAAALSTVSVATPDGDQNTYGVNSWIGYVYATNNTSSPPTDSFTVPYRGYITQTETFDQNLGSGAVSGPNLCGSYSDHFTIRFKMTENMTAGYYNFTVGGDDGYRFSYDGGATWAINKWYDQSYTSTTLNGIYLSGATNFVIDYYEQGGSSQISFTYTACTDFSTAPTAISGTASICNGSSTTLTATGGYLSGTGVYQWGTGTTVGNNIIAGQSSASITVNPTAATTYWVRRHDNSACSLNTAGITQLVAVSAQSTAPTGISGSATICQGNSTTLTATGGTGQPGAYFEWGTGTTPGNNVIAGENAASITVSPATTTTYWVRRVDGQPCNSVTGAASKAVTVVIPSSAPTSISGTLSVCAGSSVTLTASGGTLGTNGTYQWGTGTTIGSNVIAGTGASVTVTPAASTTYWVRRSDSGTCSGYTTGVTQLVTVVSASVQPTGVSGTTLICGGSSTTLTATGGTVGANGAYQWGTGYTYGANIIPGATGPALSVSPSATTTYWVRIMDASPCNSAAWTSGRTVTVNVTTGQSTAPVSLTAGSTGLCYGTGGTTLYANGAVLASGGTYQWGTGTVGTNIIAGQTSSTYYINPNTTGSVTYWVRCIDPAPCSTVTAAQTITINTLVPSTAPTAITGNASVCGGSSVTLTATGGTAAPGATYQWGTGYTVGANIISGQTASTLTVNPATSTVYWVRRVDASPCATATGGPTFTVNVSQPSTAPTVISGGSSVCSGSSVTLTATGGTMGSNATYQWGTGTTIGSNVIAGQTSASITVNPASNTTYWVRRMDAAPCSAPTAGISQAVAVVTSSVQPTSISGPATVCNGSPITLTANGSLGGNGAYQWGTGWTVGSNIIAGATTASITVSPTSNTVYWVRIMDGAPCNTPSWQWGPTTSVNVNAVSTAPTSISGTTTLCSGGSTTLTASGGTSVSGATYQWGTGSTVGSNIISGQTSASITVSPAATTTYWVRRMDASPCAGPTTGVSTTVSVSVAPTAPTAITGTVTGICAGTSTTLTASGGSNGTSGVFEWGTGTTVGANILAGQTSASITVSPSTSTTYWVRRKDATCGTSTSGVTQLVSITPATVAGTLSTPTPAVCKNTTPGAITLSGQTGNVIKWQWSTDSTFSTGVTDIANTATVLSGAAIGPYAVTRYFRAVVQNGNCSVQNTAAIAITVPTAVTYNNGSWSGTPDPTTPVIINSDLTLSSNLTVCSCQVNSAATITVPANVSLVVEQDISVAATANIVVHDKGSLVQVSDSAVNLGNITVIRKTTPMKNFDYTYWGAPVQNVTIGQLSPGSVSYQFNPAINNWSATNAATAMNAGQGYIVRAPSGWSTGNASGGVYTATFSGVPNTGVIPVSIVKSAGTFNLISNPYPSAIDIDQFILDPANASVINGTIYLWTHNTAISSTIPGNQLYNYTRDDYAKYNITGGVKTASSAVTGGSAPTGKVASGQGFFIEANSGAANGTYTAYFRNSMRVVDSNNQFWRTTLPQAVQTSPAIEKHRFWVHITNTAGAYDEMLVGYVSGATNGFDNLYDGKTFPAGNVVGIYSVLDDNSLSIQGRALPFSQADVIPLGYNTTVAGTFSIGLESFDGLFDNQDIYLVDKADNSYHNLKDGDYSFTAATGAVDTRFEVRFVNGSLGVGQHVVENGVKIILSGKHVSVRAGAENIQSVAIYDLTGKLIYIKNSIGGNAFDTADLNVAAQVLIVKVTLENGATLAQKVTMK